MDGYGSPRGGVPQPDMRHGVVPHEDLKAMTDAGEPAVSEEIADRWSSMGNSLEQAGILLQQAVFGSESGWTGQNADAMRYRLGQVAEWSMNTGQGFTTASSAVRDQSAAVGEAKTRMPDPVPYNPDQMITDAMQGGIVDIIMLPQRMYEQKQKSDAAHNEAVRVVASRDGQLATGAAAMPAFSAPPVLSNDTGGGPPEPGGPPPGGRPPGGPIGPGYPGGGPVGGPVPAPGGSGPGPVGPGPSGTAPWTGQGGPGPGLTRPDTYIPPVPGQPVVPVGMGPGPNSPSGQGPGFGPFGGFPPGGFGPGSGTGFDPARGGGGSVGGGAGGGAEGGGSRGGGPGRGLGGGAGIGGGAAAAEAAAGGRGAVGSRGGAGLGGMPMGGGHGQGDEDTEHQRPAWLLEDNPESLFGSDEMTAPSVIGE